MPEDNWRLWKALYHRFGKPRWWQNDRQYFVKNSSIRHCLDLNIQLCCTCNCVVGVQTFQRKVVPSARLYTILLGTLDTENKGARAFETSRTIYPTTQHHISEERNNRQDCRGNFGYRMSWLSDVKPRVNFTKPASNITVYIAPVSVFVYLQQLCRAKWVYGESRQRVSATLPSKNYLLFIFCLKI